MISRRQFLESGTVASTVPLFVGPAQQLPDPSTDFAITRNGRTFLNSAYIAPIPRQVQDAASEFLRQKAEEPVDVRVLLGTAERVRTKFAALINASPDEIGLLFSTAEGENVIAAGIGLGPGDNVVIDDLHYDTEFILYRELERTKGIELRIAPSRGGVAGVEEFAPLVDRRTRLLSVAWVSHRNGFHHDMRALADLAHAHGALIYADAIQAIGSVTVDVREAGVDALCAGSYKWLFAGWGVAPFFVRRSMIDRLQLDRFGEMHATQLPGGQFEIEPTARRFDYSSRAFGEVHALDAALDYIGAVGVARIEMHGLGLAERLRDAVDRLGLRTATPPGNRSPIVAVKLPAPDEIAKAAFAAAKVDVTVRSGHVRIAPGIFNTTDDIERAVEILRRMI